MDTAAHAEVRTAAAWYARLRRSVDTYGVQHILKQEQKRVNLSCALAEQPENVGDHLHGEAGEGRVGAKVGVPDNITANACMVRRHKQTQRTLTTAHQSPTKSRTT